MVYRLCFLLSVDRLVFENFQNYGNNINAKYTVVSLHHVKIYLRWYFNIKSFFSYIYKNTNYIAEDLKSKGIFMKSSEEVTLEKEYEKLEKVCTL